MKDTPSHQSPGKGITHSGKTPSPILVDWSLLNLNIENKGTRRLQRQVLSLQLCSGEILSSTSTPRPSHPGMQVVTELI
jgi:hypothetical protein